MSIISHGIIEKQTNYEMHLLDIKDVPGEIHYNPGLARDNKGTTYISIRSCITQHLEPKIHKGTKHPMHYINYLNVGILNEDTLEVTKLKEIVAVAEYDGHQWGLEDVRLFWRDDGLHGIGVALHADNGSYSVTQAEVLIDHKAGTYKLLRDYGNPKGVSEKNWSPPESPARFFDFAYSTTQVVLADGDTLELYGEEDSLQVHNGTPLLPYRDGYIQLAHVATNVKGLRTYVQCALLRNRHGVATNISQFWTWGDGWREKLQETIEFASGLLWKDDHTLLVGVGLKDEQAGLTTLDVNTLRWLPIEPNQRYYAWRYKSLEHTV